MPKRMRKYVDTLLFYPFCMVWQLHLLGTNVNRTTYMYFVGIIKLAISLPALWWCSRFSEFEPSKSTTAVDRSTILVRTVLLLSWVMDFYALSESPDLVVLWKEEANSLVLHIALDLVFAVVALMFWQRSALWMAVLLFPGASLAFSVCIQTWVIMITK